MANFKALHLVGESLVWYLKNLYKREGPNDPGDVDFVQFATGSLPDKTPATPTVGLTLYRVGWNEHLRHSGPGTSRKRGLLSLDLYYMVTAWAGSAKEEQIPFAWTLLALHQHPILDSSPWLKEADWSATDRVEIVPQDLTHEEMVRIWDKLVSPYRLSAAYVARVLQLEPLVSDEEYAPVVAKKFDYPAPPEVL